MVNILLIFQLYVLKTIDSLGNHKQKMKKYLLVFAFLLLSFTFCIYFFLKQDTKGLEMKDKQDKRYNVLFISIDDLNDWIGVLGGHPQVQTPNLDKFCKSGSVIFENAVCPGAVCGISRSAILSGFMPHHTGIYGNNTNMLWAEKVQKNPTLPEYFSQNGYHSLAAGKIFHKHFTEHGIDVGQWAFDEFKFKLGGSTRVKEDKLYDELANIIDGELVSEAIQEILPEKTARNGKINSIRWGPTQEDLEETGDYKIAEWASKQLERPFEKPFFMAVGFHNPHLPWFVPQAFF